MAFERYVPLQSCGRTAGSEAAEGAACRHPVVARTRWCCQARGGSLCGAAAPSGAWAVAQRRTTTCPWRSFCQVGYLSSEHSSNQDWVYLRTHSRAELLQTGLMQYGALRASADRCAGRGPFGRPGQQHREGPLLSPWRSSCQAWFEVRAPQCVCDMSSSHAAPTCWMAQIRLAGTLLHKNAGYCLLLHWP